MMARRRENAGDRRQENMRSGVIGHGREKGIMEKWNNGIMEQCRDGILLY
jgi:hypothetical protein